MSEADKLFEELRYGKVMDENNIYYNRYLNYDRTKVIQFKIDIQTIVVYIEDFEGRILGTDSITLQELKAINTKVKELGWEE